MMNKEVKMRYLLVLLMLTIAIPAAAVDSVILVSQDGEVRDRTSVIVKLVTLETFEEEITLSEIDKRLYNLRNQKEAIAKQLDALIVKEVELETLRQRVETEAAKVELAEP